MNTVYVEAFWDGYAMYPSRVAPMRPLNIPHGFAADAKSGWDVLRVYIEEGARHGLKIHAWLHVFHQWNTNLGGLENSPIFRENSDWAALDLSGSPLVKSEAEGAARDIYKVFLSPSNPQVRKYLRAVVGELAEKYPQLAGAQWDYIRYPLHAPGAPFDYSPDALERFKKETGGLDARKLSAKETPKEWRAWQDWKTRQVTEVVKELSEIVRKKRPRWEISAAVFADLQENLRVKQQDWKTWAEKGYVDALLPMLYSTNFAKVETWARDFKKDLAGTKTRVYPAFFIGHFYQADAKSFNADYLDLEKNLKFDGFGIFAAQSLTDDLIERLAKRN